MSEHMLLDEDDRFNAHEPEMFRYVDDLTETETQLVWDEVVKRAKQHLAILDLTDLADARGTTITREDRRDEYASAQQKIDAMGRLNEARHTLRAIASVVEVWNPGKDA